MTLTLKPWMTVLIVATICVLAGFAVGQVTQANSARDASASATDRAVYQQLRQLNRSIGANYKPNTVLSELEQITKNTYEVCDEISFASLCRWTDEPVRTGSLPVHV
jgi:predicted RND superfamily exporter protein